MHKSRTCYMYIRQANFDTLQLIYVLVDTSMLGFIYIFELTAEAFKGAITSSASDQTSTSWHIQCV